MTPFPGTFTSSPGRRAVLTDEQREWFIENFPTTINARIMKASGMSEYLIHHFARKFGLEKDAKFISKTMRRIANRTKKKLEANGYYDSMRGRQVSDATKEGTKRWWQEIREGKRLGPLMTYKQQHPRKYKAMMIRKGKERRQLINRERIRLKWGLEQKTGLTIVVMNPFTRRQTHHRHNARKRGYIIHPDCSEGSGQRYMIYYNQDTVRSALFERNLKKDGFTVTEISK